MTQFVDFKMLLLRVILILIVVISISPSFFVVTECDPDKKCEKAQLGTKVENPFDCHSYFTCVASSKGTKKASDVPVKCPQNQTFVGSYSNRCMIREKCGQLCFNICNGECTNYYYERIADIKDCSGFYTCSPGKVKVKTKCPPEAPYFDGVNCQKSKYACCSCCDECTAYCHKTYYQIADPYDCRSFYLCEKIGLPKQENRYQCPQGKYFDKKGEKCEEDNLTPCTPTCKNETNNSK